MSGARRSAPDDERHPAAGPDRQSEPRSTEILESITDPFYVLDSEGRLTFVNRAVERMWNRDRSQLLGRPLLEVFPQAEGSDSWAAHARALEEQQPVAFETISPILGIWIQATVYPIRGGGLAVYFRDISDRKRLEDQTQFLARAGEVLASSLDYEVTLRRVARLAVPAVADWCAIFILDDTGRLSDLEVVHSDPAREAAARALMERYPPRPDVPGGAYHVVRTGDPELTTELNDELLQRVARDAEHLQALRELNLRSAMTAPLSARGRTFGAISFLSDSARRFTERDVGFAMEVARRAGLAIDNARLYDRTLAAERRSAFLARASAVLASSLDYQTTIRAVANLCVPEIADWCVIDVIEENGSHEVRRVAATHVDERKTELLRRLKHLYPVDWDSDMPDALAARTGHPVLLRKVEPQRLKANVRDQEQLRILKGLGIGSVLSVPLMVRDQPLGALTLVRTSADRSFGEDDVELALELARRAASAVDNARLFESAMVANRARTDFLAVMSHELRTPLNAIIGYADLLDAGILGELGKQQLDPIRRIRVSAMHLLAMIEEILTFSRLESGTEALHFDTFDLVAVARDALERVRSEAVSKGLSLEADLPTAPIVTETDRRKLQRILASLLSNAIRFTEQGAVRLDLFRSGDSVTFRISDTGIGITPEHLQYIYEPFWQEASPLTRQTGGTGLGLPLAQRLAHLLGGELSVQSELGRGSSFELRLPLRDGGRTASRRRSGSDESSAAA